MREFVIVSDSCCDLDKQMREQLNVDYIKMFITDEKGKEYPCSLNWEDFSPREFYDFMRDGKMFRTTQIPIETYEENFEKYIKEGKDILSITCSSALSGCINAATLARTNILEKYPDAKIFCIDSLRGSLGEGMIVYYAAKMRDEGKAIEEIAEWIDANKNNIHQIGTVEDMVYLKRAGRVTGFATVMAKILNIKPIIISDSNGMNKSVAKVQGRRTSIKRIIEMTKQNIINPADQTIFIVHADCADDADAVKRVLLEEVGCKDVYINYVGPTIGATVGPGMLGVYFYGKTVTA